MPNLTIRGKEIDVDINEELSRYDWDYDAVWKADKLTARSPFRPDNTPSFWVTLEGDYAGVWGDSGAIDDDYKSGGLAKLIAYMDDTSIEEAEDYLIEKYGRVDPEAPIRISAPKLYSADRTKELPESIVIPAVSEYLTNRGISENVQRLHGVGYSEGQSGHVAIPWRTPTGKLAAVMHRATTGKSFFYAPGGTPRSLLVYGIDVINREQRESAVICEAPIDALSWWTAGIPAIATGGGTISSEQCDIIRRSSIRRLALGGDNDEVGKLFNAQVQHTLGTSVEYIGVCYGDCKDANAVLTANGVKGLRQLTFTQISQARLCTVGRT